MKKNKIFGRVLTASTIFAFSLGTVAHATTISTGISSTVSNGGIAPGSPSDYIFFGNAPTENGGSGGGQPSDLTDYTVSMLDNVNYQGNGAYTTLIAPGGTAAFTTGILTEVPTDYPVTTPHTDLLATFSPFVAGSFSVYILDGNTDGNVVGNSSVGLGVNGGVAVTTASQFDYGTNEFTEYTITNAMVSDVFQVYATTSLNNYPSIGGLTFGAASDVASTPEPGSISLCFLGLSAGVSLVRRRIRRDASLAPAARRSNPEPEACGHTAGHHDSLKTRS
jgi:hypothetical protein